MIIVPIMVRNIQLPDTVFPLTLYEKLENSIWQTIYLRKKLQSFDTYSGNLLFLINRENIYPRGIFVRAKICRINSYTYIQ